MMRNIIVTGGGSGIGYAIAAVFASAGDNVLITGRNRDSLEQAEAKLGNSIRTTVCDATDPRQVDALRAEVPETVDVLVNNAGGNTDFDRASPGNLQELAAAWRANLDANLISAVLMTAGVDDRLARGGSVISIGSIAADKGAGAYGAAKAGLASWNVGLAAELGERGITANIASPGYIADTAFFRGRLTEQRRTTLIKDAFTGRAGTPDDVAETVYFLASPQARQITGQVIAVNGGARTTR
jgi:3-oxoacyl-[acyl-carrier protein] reductase